MNELGTLGALLPLWIIGAPLLLGVLLLVTTPKTRSRDGLDRDAPLQNPAPFVDPVGGPPVMRPTRL